MFFHRIQLIERLATANRTMIGYSASIQTPTKSMPPKVTAVAQTVHMIPNIRNGR